MMHFDRPKIRSNIRLCVRNVTVGFIRATRKKKRAKNFPTADEHI